MFFYNDILCQKKNSSWSITLTIVKIVSVKAVSVGLSWIWWWVKEKNRL